jgi:hypothetical protein
MSLRAFFAWCGGVGGGEMRNVQKTYAQSAMPSGLSQLKLCSTGRVLYLTKINIPSVSQKADAIAKEYTR